MLNSAHAPSFREVINTCRAIYKIASEFEVLAYLSQVASNDFQCPDRCDEWALIFFDEHESEITSKDEQHGEHERAKQANQDLNHY